MDEFLKQFGKYAQAYGEQWRLNRPELMDAYQAACEEYNRQYQIGPRTFERVFRNNNMVNMHDLQAVMDAVERAFAQILIVKEPKFQFGDRVRKHSGAWWQGVVVGTYTTLQTPIGYCVQMETPTGNGPVQIYPEAAIEHVPAPAQVQEGDK